MQSGYKDGAVISAAITIVGLIAAIPEDAEAFTENSLTGTPCPTELASRELVTEVSVKPSKEEQN